MGRDTHSAQLFAAIKAGDRAATESLLRVDPGLLLAFDDCEFEATPLNLAAARGDLAMIDLLLAHGADIDRKSAWWAGGFAPIHSIFWSHHESLGPALIERGATVNTHASAGLGLTDRLIEILDRDPELIREAGPDGQQPLHFAATPVIAELLLERGAEIDARDIDHESTPAQWAARSRPAVTRYLLEHGAASDPFALAALDDAVALGQFLDQHPGAGSWTIDAERFVVRGSKALHIYGYTLGWQATPLHVAARCDSVSAIRLLLERGAEPAIRGDHDQATPLHIAAWEGSTRAIAELIRGGAPLDVESGPQHKNQPLGWAIASGKVEAVRVLLSYGAPIHDHHRAQATTDGDEAGEPSRRIAAMLDGSGGATNGAAS